MISAPSRPGWFMSVPASTSLHIRPVLCGRTGYRTYLPPAIAVKKKKLEKIASGHVIWSSTYQYRKPSDYFVHALSHVSRKVRATYHQLGWERDTHLLPTVLRVNRRHRRQWRRWRKKAPWVPYSVHGLPGQLISIETTASSFPSRLDPPPFHIWFRFLLLLNTKPCNTTHDNQTG